jgi:hypothetical protein
MTESTTVSLGEKYFTERMELYGITEQVNQVQLYKYDSDKKENILENHPVFNHCDKGIEILVYGLDRNLITYKVKDPVGVKIIKLSGFIHPPLINMGRK